MPGNKVPFYAQAAILDRYVHSTDPASDPVAVEVIIDTLRTKKDLRAYFFRSSPSAAWAPILWDYGFFVEPPKPEQTSEGFVLPQWDVQFYLVSVASAVPDIVLKHVMSVSGHSWYISRALKALSLIPPFHIEQTVPRIKQWLRDSIIADGIIEETTDLIRMLAEANYVDPALELFRTITAPALSPESRDELQPARRNYISRMHQSILGTRLEPSSGFESLKKNATIEVIGILENDLLESLRLEANQLQRPEHEYYSGWRSAIEDTNQDILDTYNDRVLAALRDTIEVWIQSSPNSVQLLLQRYLAAPQSILRRLGMHMLHQHPASYQGLLKEQLLSLDNKNEIDVHHEWFLLLETGYPHLASSDQQLLVAQILAGPDAAKTQALAEWAQKTYGTDPDVYSVQHKSTWIRDRLWMIRQHLDASSAKVLSGLVNEYGNPTHPAFLSWFSGAHWVKNISPFDDALLSKLSPAELLETALAWYPEPKLRLDSDEESFEGLGGALAGIVLADLQRYGSYAFAIAAIRPEFASAFIGRWTNVAEASNIPWGFALGLCDSLIALSTSGSNGSDDEARWRGVRLSIAQLLQNGFQNNDHLIPVGLWVRARDILLKLVYDPDPSLESDRPPEKYLGHDDPITLAINHVRPIALSGIIDYARLLKQQSIPKDGQTSAIPEVGQLDDIVRDTLTTKLDKVADPSRAVHSVFGTRLPTLYWLDSAWVIENLEKIFPPGADEETIWIYVAAWDAYVFNRYFHDLMPVLRSQYHKAIENLSRGYRIKSHLNSAEHFAIHLAFEYLLADYDLQPQDGKQSLIVEFISMTPPDVRKEAASAIYKICQGNPDKMSTMWPRARMLWEWRAREAAVANHSPDFTEEMEQFAQLLLLAPDNENLITLRPLLESLLPYISRHDYRNWGWDSIEKYLAQQVDQDPVQAIRFYRLMFDRRTSRPNWIYHSDEANKLIEIAAANLDSRQEALSLIDMLARQDDHAFDDVYNKYSN